MLILAIRTDKPDAELGLYNDSERLAYEIWHAHRQLAETIHQKIAALLSQAGHQLGDLEAIAVYKGPGSFTGLRIGLSVANALAASYKLPIAGRTGEGWLGSAITDLLKGESESYIVPEYGADVHITKQKK